MMRRDAISNPEDVDPGASLPKQLIACALFCLLCRELPAQTLYKMDGSLRDWGVRPGFDWTPDSPTANYTVTDNENTYDVLGYVENEFDMEAMYFDDDPNFFYFAVVTKYAFATFPVGGPPVPRTGAASGGDLGLDFDISPFNQPNTDFGMNITRHGRVVMKGPRGNATLGLDYGMRIGSSHDDLLGQVFWRPAWEKTVGFLFDEEGWQGGPWKMSVVQPDAAIGSALVAFGIEGQSYTIEGAIPRHLFPEAATAGGLVGLHLTMYCGNDSTNMVATYSPVPAPPREYFPLHLKKEIVTARDEAEGIPIINPGDLVDYLITFTNDRNTYPVTDVSLVDVLPPEVTFAGLVEAGTQGVYDPSRHTYTVTYPSLSPGESRAVRLQVRVRDEVAANTLVANTATVDAFETEPTRVTVTAIAQAVVLNPLFISKVILSEDEAAAENEEGIRLITVGDPLTYSICFTNPNDRAVTHVSILDVLPPEMAFIQATGEGDFGAYNPATHTVAWTLPQLNAGESTCLELTAQVGAFTAADTRVVNRATIDSDQTESSAAEAVALVKAIVYQPLNVSKSIVTVNHETSSAAIPLVEPGDVLTYEICYDNLTNDHLVQDVTVVDRLPAEVMFLADDSAERFGSYDPNSHAYTRRRASLLPGAGACFSITVQVRNDVSPERVITNRVTAVSQETDPNAATAVAVVKPQALPLGLIKEIVRGGQLALDGETRFVDVEEDITYALCFANSNVDRVVRNVTLVDMLPLEAVFVRATGDGEFGHYVPNEHRYVWTMSGFLPGEGQCLELTVRVPFGTPAGTRVVNHASISSDQTDIVEAEAEAIVNQLDLNSLNLSKRVSAVNQVNVFSVRPGVDPGNTLVYEIRFNNRANRYSILGLQLTDVLPEELLFIGDLSQGPLGTYDFATRTYTWYTASLAPGTEVTLKLATFLRDDVTPGSTVANVATLSAPDIDPETFLAEAEVRMPLQGTMTLSPLILGRRGVNRTDTLQAVLVLPAGVLRNAIRSDPLTLEPGGPRALSQEVFTEEGRTKMRASFSLTNLFQSIPLNGITRLTVRGRLDSGRGFFAESTVLLVEERPF